MENLGVPPPRARSTIAKQNHINIIFVGDKMVGKTTLIEAYANRFGTSQTSEVLTHSN